MKPVSVINGSCWLSLRSMVSCLLLTGGIPLQSQTSLSFDSTPGLPGSVTAVPIRLANAANISGAQFDMTFDAAKITGGNVELAEGQVGAVVRSREVAPGVRRTLIYSTSSAPLRTNGAVAKVSFHLSPNERISSGPITPSHAILADTEASAITPVSLNAGVIFVRTVNLLEDGTAKLFLRSKAGERYLIQASTNFQQWVTLTNMVAFGDFIDLLDLDAAKYPYRFYRTVSATNEFQMLGLVGGIGSEMDIIFMGNENESYVLQSSSDLKEWSNVSTNVANQGLLNFRVPIDLSSAYKFFRVQPR